MTRIGVCDDSPELCEKISKTVGEAFAALGGGFELKSFTDGGELLKYNAGAPFDVLFLDIDMPRPNGFDIAKSLREGFSDCLIVFVTSHSELVYDSLDFQPFNFIRKNSGVPLETSIPAIAGKLFCRLRQGDTVLIEDRHLGEVPVKIREIACLESSGHYIIYSLVSGSPENPPKKLVSRGSIAEREKFFEGYGFARAHKGFIVNLSQIKRLNTSKREAELSGGISVPIGKKYRAELKEKYTLFLRSRT